MPISKSTIISRVLQNISDQNNIAFSPGDLDIFFDQVIDMYSEMNPLVSRGTITTVNEQDLYAAPSGIQDVLDIASWGTPMTGVILRDFFSPIAPPFVSPANFYEYDEALADAFNTAMGDVGNLWHPTLKLEWIPDASAYQLRVNPIPNEDGQIITFYYSSIHQSDNTGDVYPSIMDKDASVLVGLLTADLLDSMADDLAKQGHIKAGDSDMDFTNSSDDLRRQAESMRQKALSKLERIVATRG